MELLFGAIVWAMMSLVCVALYMFIFDEDKVFACTVGTAPIVFAALFAHLSAGLLGSYLV